MTSLASREMTEQEMINTCTAPQMAHLIQVLRQTIRNKDKEIEKWVDMVKQLQRDGELDPPEPKPEPAFNVGDFVKYDIDTYLRVIEPSGKDKTLCKTLSGVIVYPYTSCLTKASPSEVIVKIGCLKGTVAEWNSETFMLNPLDNSIPRGSLIAFAMLDIPTRELVKSLLKAQEKK